jgi:hypothetical protein
VTATAELRAKLLTRYPESIVKAFFKQLHIATMYVFLTIFAANLATAPQEHILTYFLTIT